MNNIYLFMCVFTEVEMSVMLLFYIASANYIGKTQTWASRICHSSFFFICDLPNKFEIIIECNFMSSVHK